MITTMNLEVKLRKIKMMISKEIAIIGIIFISQLSTINFYLAYNLPNTYL